MINVRPTGWTSFLPTWHNPSKPHRLMRLLHRQNTYHRIRRRLKRRAQDCGLRSDTERAEIWFQLRAPLGSPNPRFLWCPPELFRLDVPQSYVEAMNWSLTPAKQGIPSAQTILGTIYDSGYGVPQNFVHGHSLHWADFVSPIELASVRSSTKRMAIGRPATAPPMPTLKCSGVQRSSAASTASRYVSRTFSGAPRLE